MKIKFFSELNTDLQAGSCGGGGVLGVAIRGDLESPRFLFFRKKKEIHGKVEEEGRAAVAALTKNDN
ncbi:hypothetical protein [Paenibacillus sp. FSL H7-0331]|uniref:hypothetical protein n=1 Tax=Paenibacillus sp. FSL H7-0331 TaxID=1920421 RepID=UPI00096C6C5C|nr:hypothetical protein [Paenibacillus sp. FSL H7-0331]OME97959.1 hypothetical protein BK127_39890 [Paenibacillus sp. FSL H7-0331]